MNFNDFFQSPFDRRAHRAGKLVIISRGQNVGRNSERASPRGHIGGQRHRERACWCPSRGHGAPRHGLRRRAGGAAEPGVGDQPALALDQALLLGGRRDPAARLGAGGAHPGPAGRRAAVDAPARAGLRPLARRGDRQPGGAAGPGRPARHLPVGLAGRRRRQPGRGNLPRPEPVPGQLGPPGGPAHQQRAAARRPDHLGRGRRRPRPAGRTGWRRSSPTRRRASAGCSTRSS